MTLCSPAIAAGRLDVFGTLVKPLQIVDVQSHAAGNTRNILSDNMGPADIQQNRTS